MTDIIKKKEAQQVKEGAIRTPTGNVTKEVAIKEKRPINYGPLWGVIKGGK